jgi:putative peptidoglycan lipid II flippase
MSGVMASKVLGLVRNIVIGAQYGATREYEAYLAAISVPDTVFQVLAGGTVGAAFIPVFAAYLSSGDRARAWRLTSALMNLAVLGIGAVALLLAILAPAVMRVLVAGWSPEEQAHAANLARIMMICPVIFAVSTLATSALNGARRFALAAAAPLMYNLMLIFGAVVLRPWGVEGLAVSAVLGALLHLVVQVPGLARIGMRYSLTLGRDLAGTREVVRLMGPRVLGLGVSQFNQLVNVALASFLVAGSVAYLNYAWLILMAPLGVVAMGFSTAIFPTLAEQSAQARTEEQQQTFFFGWRLILYLTVPAAVLLFVLGRPIVGTLLERGAFDATQADATAFALALFAIGLPGHAMIEIVDRVFYAERDTATPLVVAATAVVLNILFGLVLMQTQLSFGGLALSNSIAALIEATLLLGTLLHRTGWARPRDLLGFGWRVTAAAGVMGAVALVLWIGVGPRVSSQWAGQAAAVIAISAIAGAAYLGTSLALGIDDARRVAALLVRRA